MWWVGQSRMRVPTSGRLTAFWQSVGIPAPAGDPGPVDAARYSCPHGDYVWYLAPPVAGLVVGRPVVRCVDQDLGERPRR